MRPACARWANGCTRLGRRPDTPRGARVGAFCYICAGVDATARRWLRETVSRRLSAPRSPRPLHPLGPKRHLTPVPLHRALAGLFSRAPSAMGRRQYLDTGQLVSGRLAETWQPSPTPKTPSPLRGRYGQKTSGRTPQSPRAAGIPLTTLARRGLCALPRLRRACPTARIRP